jgi:hypothetical protein
MAFLFLIIFLFFFFKKLDNQKSRMINIIVILIIAIIHNTTALIMVVIFALYLILRLVLSIDRQRFTNFDRSIYRSALLLSVLYLSYNLYVASQYFFEKGVIPAVLDYITSVMLKEFSPIEFFSAKYELYVSESTTTLGSAIVKPLFYLGYISTGLFIGLFLFDLLRRLIKKHEFCTDEKMDVMYIFGIAALVLLIINSLLWFFWHIAKDFYYRFFAYTYLFIAVIVTLLIVGLYRANGKIRWVSVPILAAILAQSLLLTHPVSLFGADTPLSLEDVRIGPRQAVATAHYLQNRFGGQYIFGTRYAFNVIAPRAVIDVFELHSCEILRKGELNVISLTETKILDLMFPEKYNILFSTGEFWIVN